MKQTQRYRRKVKGGALIDEWPTTLPSPEQLAERVSYAGSPEHKGRPLDDSYDFEPVLRSDASRCDPGIDRSKAEASLRAAIRSRCVSTEFDGAFPRYVWGRVDGRPHVARLDNRETGAYKGWPIGVEELPIDREGRLAAPTGDDDA